MNNNGSMWRKWDLHIHTPCSFHWNDGPCLSNLSPPDQERILDKAIEQIEKSDVAAYGVMDYWTFDGYWAIKDRLTSRGLKTSKTIFPGMELRIEAPVDYRLNIHVLLSDDLSKQQLQDFKGALRIGAIGRALSNESLIAFAKTLDPSKARVHGFSTNDLKNDEKLLQLGSMTALITRESLRDAIKQIPDGSCLVILPYDTSDGLSKLDWESHPYDDNYFMQSAHMFETRDPDNVDLFLGRKTEKNQKYLHNFLITMGGKPKPAISGSDAHKVCDYGAYPSQRITWIKADPTFEGLRQARYELSRVTISAEKPLEPLHAIRKVVINLPTDTNIQSELSDRPQPEPFCFRGKHEIFFSPYLTCIVGGRGSGKSTLLNLIHEKLRPGEARFFRENRLVSVDPTTLDACMSIDGDSEQHIVEFLQQNEVEQFASAPLGFTKAIFSRLAKLDTEGEILNAEAQLGLAAVKLKEQATRLKERHEVTSRISAAEKELATSKGLISSFENDTYKAINDNLANATKELQAIRNWRKRLEDLIKELATLASKQSFPPSEKPNFYENEYFTLLAALNALARPIQDNANHELSQQREVSLDIHVSQQKRALEEFLKARGLSPENLADVGKANESVARIEQELPSLKSRIAKLAEEIAAFRSERHLIETHSVAVTKSLAPINRTLSEVGKEVKAIELRYEFDEREFKEAILRHIQQQLGTSAPRIDHLRTALEAVDFKNLNDRDDLLARLPEKQVTAKALRDYLSSTLNFELLKLEVEQSLMDYTSFGRVRVFYDGKPVENSSFGQRCTAAIVILLLLGNTPIVIDEPEAHLDSSLIANYLVELIKTAKLNRQIIFATHNANFVINGDAELVHVLQMSEEKRTRIHSVTIENLEHRDKLLALEGGVEAFQKRESRYGI